MSEPRTLPALLLRNAERLADRTAFREKDRGIWQSFTWRDARDHVRDFALGLSALGFRRGEALSVIGDNRTRLYWAQLAAQALGGVAVPVYQDSIARELQYVWSHADVAVIVAEDQEQVDKILALREALPALRLVVYEDPRGMSQYRFDWLRSFADVEDLGRRLAAEEPGRFEAEVTQGQAQDVAVLCYTSGTTGDPKGAMLPHGSLIDIATGFVRVEGLRAEDDSLAYLPMAWVGDVTYTTVVALLSGCTTNCPEGPETVQRDLRELGPSVFLAPPRIWENILAGVQVRAADASPLKQRIFEWCRAAGERAELLRSDDKPVPAGLRLACALADFFVFGPVRDQLGLRRVRHAYTGGAPLGADTFRFYRAFGVPLKQLYGSTETSGIISVQPNDEANPTTAGRPCPGVEVRVADKGEILIRTVGRFAGYLKGEASTREVLDADGWFHTGDAGFLDPRGHLVIIDRAKDVGKLDDGTAFAPQFIENKLKFSPYVREAVAFGHGRPFVAAMLAIDLGTVGAWAERRGVPYTSYADLSQKLEVRALIRDEIRKTNRTLPENTRVRRFLLLPKDLDADDAEVTRTRKVRRLFVAERYADVIAAFYAGADQVALTVTITYEDGRQSTIQAQVPVGDVEVREAAGV